MNTIKRNKKVLEYMKLQLQRLQPDNSITNFFQEIIVPNLPIPILLQITNSSNNITYTIFDNDDILLETLKIIGIMEAAETNEEFLNLKNKRIKIKDNKKELNDFDKLLKGIMKAPAKDKKKEDK